MNRRHLITAPAGSAGELNTTRRSVLTAAGSPARSKPNTFEPFSVTRFQFQRPRPPLAGPARLGRSAVTVTTAPSSDALQRTSRCPRASAMYGRRPTATSSRNEYLTGTGLVDHPTLFWTLSSPGPGTMTAGGSSHRSVARQHERLFGAT